MRSGALVVVVDTNRPEMVEAPKLLEKAGRIAVIDHHRRAATYIDNAALNFHEPYASSASELVSELLQYLTDPADVLEVEAEALLAGIVLDTKNFTVRTGGRTFDAAAYLRRAGADTGAVHSLFQNDLDSTINRYDVIRRAERVHGNIALAAVDIPVGRVIAAQAADELLQISGIGASFVVTPNGANVNLSARSSGDVNVQVILEKLGGGGNANAAGGVVENAKVSEVRERLLSAIDAYFAG
jgi:c-di-AMP phosphodiesterase-like protein